MTTQPKTPTRRSRAAAAATEAKGTEVVSAETPEVETAEPTAAQPTFEFPKFDLSKFEFPAMDLSSMSTPEMPEMFRGLAEKAVAQAKANFEKLKGAAEEATDAIEDTYETARAGLIELNSKSIDAAKATSDAVYGHAKTLLTVKTFAEAIELQTAFLRQQFETITAQAKDLREAAAKLATETSQPAKDAMTKTLESMKPKG